MTLKILIDMNLSPDWVDAIATRGRTAVHWQSIGSQKAKDREIMSWARTNGYSVFTHDLDFGTLLALTRLWTECDPGARPEHFAGLFGTDHLGCTRPA